MKISARVDNSGSEHEVVLRTNDHAHTIVIPPKSNGMGSSANGGELLFLALATCYCNDLYREAGKRGLTLTRVEVEVEGEFGGEGEPARDIRYRAKVASPAPEETIRELLAHTDTVAEIHNTLRQGRPVTLEIQNMPVI